jgi:hypothetical protein
MNNYEEDRDIYNGMYDLEVIIDRPVKEVWDKFVEMGSWVTNYDIEVVSGVGGAVGSITRVSPKNAKELNIPPAPYHLCKIVKLVPERQYVLKTTSAKGGSYGGIEAVGFDDARFIDVGGKTKITFNLYSQMRTEAAAKDPAVMDKLFADSRAGMLENLNNLKRMVERR